MDNTTARENFELNPDYIPPMGSMTTTRFNHIVKEQLKRSTDVLVTKAAEYASGDDRLHNFRQAAHMTGVSPRVALAGMMIKHTTSIYDMLQVENWDTSFPQELWDEKITDHINYLLLLAAIVREENDHS